MSNLTIIDNSLGSTTKINKIEESPLSKKSSLSYGSVVSEHGSKFGRSVAKLPKRIDSYLVKSMSTANSRVIPTVFNFKIQHGSKLPDITKTEATDSIRIIGKALNVLDYEFNYASFWLLDVLSKLIKDLQLKKVSFSHQNTFLAWFQFVLRSISVTGSSREEIFDILREMFKVVVEMIHKGFEIPQPEDIKIEKNLTNSLKLSEGLKNLLISTPSKSSLILSEYLKSRKRTSSGSSSHSRNLGNAIVLNKSLSRKPSISNKNVSEDKIKMKIDVFYQFIEMIYEVFADRFVYNAIVRAYSSPSILTPVELNIEFYDPKPLKPEPVSPEKTPKTPKKSRKTEKNKRKKSRNASKMSADIVLKGKKKGNLSVKENKEEAKSELSIEEVDKKISDVEKSEEQKRGKSEGKENIEEAKSKPSTKGKGKKTCDVKKHEGEKKEKSEGKEKINEAKSKPSKKGGDKKSIDVEKSEKEKRKSDGQEKKDEAKSAPTKKGKDKENKEASVVEKIEGKTKGKSPAKAKNEPAKKVREGKDNIKRKSSSKSRKSRGSSLTEREVGDVVEKEDVKAMFKLFERTIYPDMEHEKEKACLNHQFILPLSEAVDNKYFENLLKVMIPTEGKPKELIVSEDNERQRKKSNHSSVKKGSKGKTKKKKK